MVTVGHTMSSFVKCFEAGMLSHTLGNILQCFWLSIPFYPCFVVFNLTTDLLYGCMYFSVQLSWNQNRLTIMLLFNYIAYVDLYCSIFGSARRTTNPDMTFFLISFVLRMQKTKHSVCDVKVPEICL